MVCMRMQEGIPPDIVTYNSLLKAAGAAGLMPQVQRLYEVLQAREGRCCALCARASLLPSSPLPNCGCCKRCVAEGAGGRLQCCRPAKRCPQGEGLRPTAITFATLFTAAARNRHSDMAWLLRVRCVGGWAGCWPLPAAQRSALQKGR